MSEFETISLERDDRGVATLTLNRPQKHNVINAKMIAELSQAADQMVENPPRICVLTGAGETFCAGGDLAWMEMQTSAPRDTKIEQATILATMLAKLDDLPFPMIAKISGNAFGGGIGMISVCDIAVCIDTARFALTEVLLGLVPATISPFVVRKIGEAKARQHFVSAQMFGPVEAKEMQLVSNVCNERDLDSEVEKLVTQCLKAKPQAQAKAKQLAKDLARGKVDNEIAYTAQLLADCWESDEAQQAIGRFLAARKK